MISTAYFSGGVNNNAQQDFTCPVCLCLPVQHWLWDKN